MRLLGFMLITPIVLLIISLGAISFISEIIQCWKSEDKSDRVVALLLIGFGLAIVGLSFIMLGGK